MGSYVTVSAKVRKELVEEARRLNINLSQLIRESLEREVRRRRLALVEKRLTERKGLLEKIDLDRMVSHIREDRERGL